jgi:hypothetical protein
MPLFKLYLNDLNRATHHKYELGQIMSLNKVIVVQVESEEEVQRIIYYQIKRKFQSLSELLEQVYQVFFQNSSKLIFEVAPFFQTKDKL